MGSSPVARPEDLPEGFQLDPELPAGFTLDEPAAAPITESGYSHPLARFGSSALHEAGATVNPKNYARALKALGMTFTGLMNPITSLNTARGVARGVAAIPGAVAAETQTPEGLGRLAVQGASLAIPVGDIGAVVARRGVPILGGASEVSRAYNIKRALRIPTGTGKAAIKAAQDIESMAPEIALPVTKSPQKLADALKARVAMTGEAVGTAEDVLPAHRISTASVTSRIPPTEGTWRTSPPRAVDVPSGPTEFETVTVPGRREFVPYNPEAAAQRQVSVADLERLGAEMTTQEAIGAKRAAQRAAFEKGAYATPEARGAAAAAEERATALRQTLEALPGPEAAAFTKANRAHHVAETIAAPANVEATRVRGLPLATRSSEMLFGRAFTQNPSILGAVGGVLAGNILDSRLFHTASAAIKRSVIDALNSGQPQLAADILFKSGVAANATRRHAAAALAAQGEGVTIP